MLDNPWSQEEDVRQAYVKMAGALNRTGREIMFSTSGAPRPWLWGRPVVHLWRTAGDLNARFVPSIMGTVDRQEETLCWAGPGFWADPDSLQFGPRSYQPGAEEARPSMTQAECRAQFSLWAVMASPLILGMDLRQVDEATLKIVRNRDIIAVDQDALGIPGRRIRRDGDLEVFARRLTDGQAVVLLNRGKEPAEMRVTAAELGLAKKALEVRDLWTGEKRSITDGVLSARGRAWGGHGESCERNNRGFEFELIVDTALQTCVPPSFSVRPGFRRRAGSASTRAEPRSLPPRQQKPRLRPSRAAQFAGVRGSPPRTCRGRRRASCGSHTRAHFVVGRLRSFRGNCHLRNPSVLGDSLRGR